MPWIEHPATQDGPVSLFRWLKFKIGDRLEEIGRRWADEALYPNRCPECGAAMPRRGECDHIPF